MSRALVAALSRQFRAAPDGGTHAASEWSLRQWGAPLPALAEEAGGRRWFVNRAGMTMVGIPAGVVRRGRAPPAVLSRPYYVGDCEVTLGQFRRFLAEAAERPADWKPIPDLDLGPGHPLHGVLPAHVTLFCNWLSAREGRRPCYPPLLLRAGDRAGYQALRRRLLDRYEATADARLAERIAKACLVGEGADVDRVLRLLETAARRDAPPWLRPYASSRAARTNSCRAASLPVRTHRHWGTA